MSVPVSNLQSPISVGVLGGTFDPPHNGHMHIAHEALTQLNLDRVLFAPTRQPPHKLDKAITPIEHRLEMVRLAIEKYPRFVLSRVDVDRDGPTFTVDTMRLLRAEMPASRADFYFILGMDSLANILLWHQPEELIQLCKLAVFARPGFIADVELLEHALPGLRERVVFIRSATLEISATELERRARSGLSIRDSVPASVAEYIAAHKLYRE